MQPDLTQEILELVRLTATSLPEDVERAIAAAHKVEEDGSVAKSVLDTILKNVKMAREHSTPICQDTGTPIFYVDMPAGWSTREMRRQIEAAVAEATRRVYLRPNAVNSLTGKNTGNNLGDEYFPTIHFHEVDGDTVTIRLMLKGGGSENVSTQYKLPDTRLHAGRDLEGVYKVVMDAVYKAQGKGCAPGFLGVGIGGDRGSSFYAAKEALWRTLDEPNPDPDLDALEKRITEDANKLGIGPMGLGGKTTVMATRIKAIHRLPACYFVSIAYMCWAYRRHTLIYKNGKAEYK